MSELGCKMHVSVRYYLIRDPKIREDMICKYGGNALSPNSLVTREEKCGLTYVMISDSEN